MRPGQRTELEVFIATSSELTIKIWISGRRVIGISDRGVAKCEDGSRRRQLFAEGVPSLHSLTHVNSRGRFHFREYDPRRYGLPASFEAMRGRVDRHGIRGRIRFWERRYLPSGRPGLRCGTVFPAGKWVDFHARRLEHRLTSPRMQAGLERRRGRKGFRWPVL